MPSSGFTQTCAEAVAAYVDTNEWQLSEIQAALTEAEAQDYASDQDMADLALKWNAGAHAGRPNMLLAILP